MDLLLRRLCRGVAFAVFTLRGLLALAPVAVRDLGDVGLDVRALLFTTALSVVLAAVFKKGGT